MILSYGVQGEHQPVGRAGEEDPGVERPDHRNMKAFCFHKLTAGRG